MEKNLDKTLENEFFQLESCLNDKLRTRAFEYCKKFLGGAWCQIRFEQLDLRYIKGGLTNYLYLCQLPNNYKTIFDEPTRVLLRLYGEILDQATKFNEAVIFNILSERKFGPKLLGVFPAGRLEEFIDTRCLKCIELYDPVISRNIATQMAIYHSMKIPITKNENWLFTRINSWLTEALDMLNDLQTTNETLIKIRQLLINIHLIDEIENLKRYVLELNSPLVFCHNDVQEGNIMFTSKDQINKDICLIDFEYSSYNYRGFDFGNHFCEWIFKNIDENELGFSWNYSAFPNYDQQMNFISAYLHKQQQLLVDENAYVQERLTVSPQKLIEEANRFFMISHIFWGLWSFVQFRLSKIEYNYLEYAYARFHCYLHFKDVFKISF